MRLPILIPTKKKELPILIQLPQFLYPYLIYYLIKFLITSTSLDSLVH